MSDTTADTTSDAGSADSGLGAIRVRRALISVSDKTGVVDFAKTLAGLGVEILSTGGPATATGTASSTVPVARRTSNGEGWPAFTRVTV